MTKPRKTLILNDGRRELMAKRRAAAALRKGGGGEVKPAAAAAPSTQLSKLPAAQWIEQVARFTPPVTISQQRKSLYAKLGLFVLLPTFLMTLYVFWYASPRYVSEFQITYESNAPSAATASSGILSSLMGATGGTDMSQVLQTYLTSAAVAEYVDKEVGFRKHYSSSKIDWLDRLSPSASAEKYLLYFNRRLNVVRQLGGFVTVDIEAFDPKMAQKVGQALAKTADTMVNGMMDRPHVDAVAIADAELKRTENVLRQATLNVTNFRNKHSDVNIQGSANSVDTNVASLESQLSQANSDLADAKAFLSDNAPSVVALKVRITSLKDQIESERKKLGYAAAGSKAASGKLPYSQVIAEYSALQTEEKFATDSYVSAKKAYDTARAMLAQKSGYVVSFVPPNLPQASTSPDPTTYILSAFLVSLLSYTIGMLLIGSFRDKAGG